MIEALKKHPFAVAAHFNRSVVFTFAVPKAALQDRIPECLSLDTFNDTHAFIAIALVDTRNLRPKGFPAFMGNNFILVGYRVFVRYIDTRGKHLRGLYILKSETNKGKMKFFGNLFTRYNYGTTDIIFSEESNGTRIYSNRSKFEVQFRSSTEEAPLPDHSPFGSWKEARRFAGPLPFTFTYNKTNREVLIIEGVRKNWKPKPVEVLSHSFDFIEKLDIEGIALANAFEITNVPYYWKKGKREQWTP